jgi:hypothetical protein
MIVPATHFWASCECGHETRIEVSELHFATNTEPEWGGEYSRDTCEACGLRFSDDYLDDRYHGVW